MLLYPSRGSVRAYGPRSVLRGTGSQCRFSGSRRNDPVDVVVLAGELVGPDEAVVDARRKYGAYG